MKLKYTPAAIRDLQNMSSYISDVLYNPAAANRIKKNILKACGSLKQQPMMGGSVKAKIGYETDLRFLICEKHLIFYRIEEDEISVSRVIDGKMDYARILFGDDFEENE